MTEAQLQGAIMQAARLKGWLVFHVHDSRRQVRPGALVGDRDAAGFPDLLMVRAGRMLVLELKTDKGKLTLEQQLWLAHFENVAARNPTVEARVVRPNDLDEILELL